MKVVYLSSVLPKRSETFVYKEVLGLRDLGFDVGIASLYPPEKNLGEERLERLAEEAVPVYGAGMPRLLLDAAAFFLFHPGRVLGVVGLALRDALLASDVGLGDRPKIIFQSFAALALARRLSRGGAPGHLHVHMAHAAATVGMYAARALGIPFSFTGHAADIFRERCLLEEKLRRASFVACISEWHRDWYQTHCPRPEECYPVIRCGVDVPPSPTPSVGSLPIRLLGLGRLVSKKGFDVLVEACRILEGEGIPVDCTIAGEGPEARKLKELASGMAIRFPGAVDNRDVPALLEKTDIFVLPCRISPDGDRDGIPVVLMEAMAAGVCAVSGDIQTIHELVADKKTGCLVRPGDAHDLAGCLRELALDPDLRSALAAAGKARVQEEFSSSKNLARLEAAITAHHTT